MPPRVTADASAAECVQCVRCAPTRTALLIVPALTSITELAGAIGVDCLASACGRGTLRPGVYSTVGAYSSSVLLGLRSAISAGLVVQLMQTAFMQELVCVGLDKLWRGRRGKSFPGDI